MKPSQKSRPQEEVEGIRTGLGVEALKRGFQGNIQGRHQRTATHTDLSMAVSKRFRSNKITKREYTRRWAEHKSGA
jgi:hypothetical protein